MEVMVGVVLDSQGKNGADGGGYGPGYSGKGGKGSKGGGEIVNKDGSYIVRNRDWSKSGTGGSGCHSGGGGGGGAGGGWGEFFANNIVSTTGKKDDTEIAIVAEYV